MQWPSGVSQRDLCAAEWAGEGAFKANGKSRVIKLLPAAEEFGTRVFCFCTYAVREVKDADGNGVDGREGV